ncbi:MAG: GFA family protein [Gammaproteobacteria bacterium]|nr:GFA family protein [Gammaproteobacteria bacterium]
MKLEGSCHCRKVRFTVEATEPYPFNRCYCSICRKTAGTGGFAINLGAQSSTLSIEGKEEISIYHARLDEAGEEYSEGERHFCRHCGTALWVYDPRWPELVHPHAGAIDTPLPEPPSATHMMLASKPDWVRVDARDTDECFNEYPNESLAEWHRRHAL